MEQNVGKNDKLIRVFIALAFAMLGMIYSPWYYLMTIILLVTIFSGFCWPYKLLGINTNKKGKNG
jgi:hypothetical protein